MKKGLNTILTTTEMNNDVLGTRIVYYLVHSECM